MQSSAGTIFQFEQYPPLFTYNVEYYSSSKVNIVGCLVSIPAVWLFLGSALTIPFGLQLVDNNNNFILFLPQRKYT